MASACGLFGATRLLTPLKLGFGGLNCCIQIPPTPGSPVNASRAFGMSGVKFMLFSLWKARTLECHPHIPGNGFVWLGRVLNTYVWPPSATVALRSAELSTKNSAEASVRFQPLIEAL